MNFLTENPLLSAGSLLLALWLFIPGKFALLIETQKNRLQKNLPVLLLALMAAIYIFGYLLSPAWYTSYPEGTTGDNYRYAWSFLNTPRYYTPQHFYFPFIPGLLVKLLHFIGIIKTSYPGYPENIISGLSLVNRIFSIAGFAAVFFLLRLCRASLITSLSGSLLAALAWACWFWNIQPNARGFLITTGFIALLFHVRAVKKPGFTSFIAAALSAVLCVFTHIGGIYTSAGLGFSLLFFSIISACKQQSLLPFARLLLYAALLAVFGILFWFLAAEHFGTGNLNALYQRIACPDYIGPADINPLRFFLRLFKDGSRWCMTVFLGLIQHGRKNGIEKILIVISLGSFFSLLMIIIKNYRKILLTQGMLLLPPLCMFLSALAGFSIRTTGVEYYSAILPALAGLLLLLWAGAVPNGLFYQELLPLLLAAGMLGTNGFSSTRVSRFTQPADHIIYRTLDQVRKAAGENKIIYCGTTGSEFVYNFEWIRKFYLEVPESPYRNIRWEKNLPSVRFAPRLSDQPGTYIINTGDYSENQIRSLLTAANVKKTAYSGNLLIIYH
ncbi:MAG: hypothetical protein A2096_06890 [Spirochaetes bacterium GWF1_41_5]|nr:MAG: hypothetical protein A2096_06890 [Spirochaetes bacterium GWF1_41_5]HBE03600.1 hypothetical protein [Spirochaetia bacterium]